MAPIADTALVADQARRERCGSCSRRAFVGLTGGTLGAAAFAACLAACGGSVPAVTPTVTAARQVPATIATAAAASDPYGYGYAPSTSPTAAPAPATAGAAAAEVQIADFGFAPDTLAVPVGTVVTWRNTGVQHTTTSVDKVWDSGSLATGATFSFTFAKPGSYEYRCTFHPAMKGAIEVR